jgi:hypothetical protein
VRLLRGTWSTAPSRWPSSCPTRPLPAQAPRAGNDPLHDEELDLRTQAVAALAEAENAWDELAPGRALEATHQDQQSEAASS